MLYPIRGQSDDYVPLGGIAIHVNSKGQHAGFLLRVDSVVLYLHMAWHYDFRVEIAPRSGYFANVKLNRPNLLLLSSWLKKKAKIDKLFNQIPYKLEDIPYSFFCDRTPFDMGGNWADSKTGAGLTCATFIVATFDTLKFNFINKSAWREREGDAVFISMVVSGLRESLQDPTLTPQFRADLQRHVEYIETNMDRISRVRPLDVVGAALRWDGANFLDFNLVSVWSSCSDQILKTVNLLAQTKRPQPFSA
ncbi:hypothetical protein HQ393_07865 [Chitinibacter bivalviorum]|uniref:Uncharacterized protein n=1 Tax=Chitinibacter bivalviorum TaxID=2739434 RepID=A0A7H9BJI8_9NEIS|nr:hypothetical protein [Chitinibacter bivalviorum]QLG88171.1 hypothetical protein HQ393_07865 [Chitinibacter bivalviorum]